MRILLALAACCSLACHGAVGPAGPTGLAGPTGAAGAQGAPGASSSAWLQGIAGADGIAQNVVPAPWGNDALVPPAISCLYRMDRWSPVWVAVGGFVPNTNAPFCALYWNTGQSSWFVYTYQIPPQSIAGWWVTK